MAKVYCIICGKPPEMATECPSCHTQNLCKYHIYRVFTDQEDSPLGCPRCGPRCTMCNTQTPLVHYKERPVCTSCKVALTSAEKFKREKFKEFLVVFQTVLSTVLTLLGIAIGIYLGTQPNFQKIITDFTKVEMPRFILITVWGMIGLITGSLTSTVLNHILKTE